MAAVTRCGSRTAPAAATTTAKIAEGKTPKEALRALKRRISDASGPPWPPTPRARGRGDGSVAEGGSGRATGERLCRQRGRLTPRDTGSSAKPLPNPTEGYDQQAKPGTNDGENTGDRPKTCLTTKEDSFWPAPRWEPMLLLGVDTQNGEDRYRVVVRRARGV